MIINGQKLIDIPKDASINKPKPTSNTIMPIDKSCNHAAIGEPKALIFHFTVLFSVASGVAFTNSI